MNFPAKQFTDAMNAIQVSSDLKLAAQRALSLVDLTNLNEGDSVAEIAELCRNAVTPFGAVAAVCVYQQFVSFAKAELQHTDIKVATVANFPGGNQLLDDVVLEIQKEILHGADEIDVVLPYQDFLAGKIDAVREFLKVCRETCGKQVHLKVILESGLFPNPEKIYEASHLIIETGANFLKTSTGKVKVNATHDAAVTMMLAIQESGQPVGFKAAGGIRTTEEASQYLSIADHLLGPDWATAETFRFGASSLLNDLLMHLS